MKNRSERRKHCALAVVRWSQKFTPRRRPPSRGHGTAKILSVGDGHCLHPQTQFGEDRCTQFRVIVVTDPQCEYARAKSEPINESENLPQAEIVMHFCCSYQRFMKNTNEYFTNQCTILMMR